MEEEVESTPAACGSRGDRQQGEHLDEVLVDQQGMSDDGAVGWKDARKGRLRHHDETHEGRSAQGRGRHWLVAGAVAAGLATSVKYNLCMLLIPATVAWWQRHRCAA